MKFTQEQFRQYVLNEAHRIAKELLSEEQHPLENKDLISFAGIHPDPREGRKEGLFASISIAEKAIRMSMNKYHEDVIAGGGSQEGMLQNRLDALNEIKEELRLLEMSLKNTSQAIQLGINYLNSKKESKPGL